MADPQFSSPKTLKEVIGMFSVAGIVPLVLSMLTKLNERRAKKRTDYDVERYEVMGRGNLPCKGERSRTE